MSEVTFTKKSGLIRAYFTPKDWRLPLPNIKEILKYPEKYNDLMQHIALNHKGLNWKFYKFLLTKETYPIFIYSLVYCAKDLKPTEGYSWQIQKNANRTWHFMNKNHIFFNPKEIRILRLCQNFTNCDKDKKNIAIEQIEHELNNYYSWHY